MNQLLIVIQLDPYYPSSIVPFNWRASLVPAAAVIPAPIAYIKVVAVKKLVVDPSYCE